MITLMRDGITMEVSTELQASVFLRAGYKRVEQVPETSIPDAVAKNDAEPEVEEKVATPNVATEPEQPVKQRRRRRVKSE